MRTAFCFAFILVLTSYASAQGPEGSFNPRDAADGVFGRAGDLSGTPEERGQRIHDQTIDQQMQRIQDQQGDGAMLHEEQNYRRQHSSGYPEANSQH